MTTDDNFKGALPHLDVNLIKLLIPITFREKSVLKEFI